jgi:hypothetical protein
VCRAAEKLPVPAAVRWLVAFSMVTSFEPIPRNVFDRQVTYNQTASNYSTGLPVGLCQHAAARAPFCLQEPETPAGQCRQPARGCNCVSRPSQHQVDVLEQLQVPWLALAALLEG